MTGAPGGVAGRGDWAVAWYVAPRALRRFLTALLDGAS